LSLRLFFYLTKILKYDIVLYRFFAKEE